MMKRRGKYCQEEREEENIVRKGWEGKILLEKDGKGKEMGKTSGRRVEENDEREENIVKKR